jgi:hypothetical protein
VVKVFRNVLAKIVAGAARWDVPASAVIGVWPQKVAHGALFSAKKRSGNRQPNKQPTKIAKDSITNLVGYLLDSVHLPDTVECLNVGRQSTMQAKDLSKYINSCSLNNSNNNNTPLTHLVLDEARQRKVVEDVGKVGPHCGASILA